MLIWMIIGMAVVTAVPRFLPVMIVDFITFPKWMDRWLNAIPYAALGALIFPGIMSVKPEAPQIGVIAGLVGILLAWLNIHIIFVVLGSIASVFLLTL
ncbi:AzlD domain-containing protein [Halobacillus karajensis]|uniref:Membrane protein n=1 Tax=Halobacillus karajensis TaxID=195088 RepID=A0A059NZ72_9BACI|nr:AzlD domain-containing protein [Halobacillus karajensis]CDQ21140.1 putative membrane protein [Halobacillus karajensis]CDQ24796.1 putative membrane protein [Halobacillus karajensis]CDQ28844.1 putative membrane protein [Halobacillus karajensis]